MESMNILFNHLKQNSSFNLEEINTICSLFRIEKLSKEEALFQKGNRYTKIVFVIEGVLRTFIHNKNGEEIIKNFITEKEFFSEIESFENNMPCAFNVSSITNCIIATLSRSNSKKLSEKIPVWEHAMKSEAIKAMNNMIRKQEFLNKGEAAEKYQYFVRNFPKLAQQIPLKHIASYLHITQSSLSRIRKQAW